VVSINRKMIALVCFSVLWKAVAYKDVAHIGGDLREAITLSYCLTIGGECSRRFAADAGPHVHQVLAKSDAERVAASSLNLALSDSCSFVRVFDAVGVLLSDDRC
jgi:hypothetical protein